MNIEQLNPGLQERVRNICSRCYMFADCMFAANSYRRGEPCRALTVLLEQKEIVLT